MKKIKVGILTIFTILCLTLTLFPGVPLIEAADSTNKTVSLGTSGMKTGDSFYLGKNGKSAGNPPIEWLILDADKSNVNSEEGMFAITKNQALWQDNGKMFCDDTNPLCTKKTTYTEEEKAFISDYKLSRVRQVLETNEDSFRKTISNFTQIEQNAMMETMKSDNDYYSPANDVVNFFGSLGGDSSQRVKYSRATTDILQNDRMFLLSVEEAYKFMDVNSRKITNPSFPIWYLRSGINHLWNQGLDLDIGVVDDDGRISNEQGINTSNMFGRNYVRPGMNVNKPSIYMTTPANQEKPNELALVEDYTGNQYKLTFKDNSSEFKSSAALDPESSMNVRTGLNDQIKINHKALSAMNNEYSNVTAMITDTTGNNVLYYGSLNTEVDSDNTIITIPEAITAGSYKLSLFAEDWNGINQSDYISEAYTTNLTVSDPITSSIVYKDKAQMFNNFKAGYNAPTTYIEGNEISLPAKIDIEKEGYTFAGWYDNAQFNNAPITKIDKTQKGTQTFYAKWATNHTVTFKGYNNEVLDTQIIEDGTSALAPTPPLIVGYTFIGWDKAFHKVTSDMIIKAIYQVNKYKVTFVDENWNILKQEQVEYNKAATAPKIPVKLGYLFNGWDKNFDHVISEMVIRATYKEILFTPPSSTPSLPLPKEETPMKPTQDKPKTPADSESVKKYFNSVENKSTGTKIETINEDKIFESNVEVVIKDAKGKDKQKASQKIDNIIKVFDILLKQDGVRMEKKLDSKIRIYIDAKDYADYKDLKIYQKTSAGKYIELPMEVKNGKITFECDSLDTYVLSGTKETFPWWIPIGVLAVGGIVLFAYMKYKKSDK